MLVPSSVAIPGLSHSRTDAVSVTARSWRDGGMFQDQPISTTSSISTGCIRGSSATPTADRACASIAEHLPRKFEAPLTTAG